MASVWLVSLFRSHLGTARVCFGSMNPSVSTGDLARDALRDKKRDVDGKPRAAPLRPIELKEQPLSAFPLKQAPFGVI